MKIAFDTNVILDAMIHRECWEVAEALILAVSEDKAEGVITANTVTDIYYITRKRLGDQKTREAIWNLMSIFEIALVDEKVCLDALATPMKDFEDAVMAVAAKRVGAEIVVTRDEGFLSEGNAPIHAISPKEAMEIVNGKI